MAAPLVEEQNEFYPGNAVPESGIYVALHDEHREPHLVSAVKLEIFPECRKCRGRVRFRRYLESPHMTHDWDLAGPSLELLK